MNRNLTKAILATLLAAVAVAMLHYGQVQYLGGIGLLAFFLLFA